MLMTSQPVHRAPARGMSLVEVMIGLLLGMLVTLVIAQVMAFAEGQKRVTTGGSDARVNGALALYNLQREIQMAGYGLIGSQDALGCPVKAKLGNGGTLQNWSLAPVTITAGAGAAPDQIRIVFADRAYSVPIVTSTDHTKTDDHFVVRSVIGAAVGDLMIAVPSGYDAATNWCTAFSVSGITGSNQLAHAPVAGSWNQDAVSSILPAGGYAAGTVLVNAGNIVQRQFTIDANHVLQQTSLNLVTAAQDTQDLYPQIVQLKAFYGKDTSVPPDGVVDVYDATTPTTNAGWRQVLSIRMAVVARSASYDKEEVTQSEPVWDLGKGVTVTGASTCGTSQCVTLKVDGLGDWKHYRYAVYDVVAPLRNMLWSE